MYPIVKNNLITSLSVSSADYEIAAVLYILGVIILYNIPKKWIEFLVVILPYNILPDISSKHIEVIYSEMHSNSFYKSVEFSILFFRFH